MVPKPRSVQSSRWDEAIFFIIPGTSCLATIVLSLRDKIHSTAEALLNWRYGVETPGSLLQPLRLLGEGASRTFLILVPFTPGLPSAAE
jgi:hypothetical protein